MHPKLLKSLTLQLKHFLFAIVILQLQLICFYFEGNWRFLKNITEILQHKEIYSKCYYSFI